MTRSRKIVLIVLSSLAGLVLILVVAGIIIVQTPWFRDMVHAKIVAAVEDSTGGKVELGSFQFDWQHLRATVRNFVIHGLEPAGAAPLFRAKLLQVDLKLLSPFKGFVDIAYLLVDTPQAALMVLPDGRTNIPAPRIQSKSSGKTGLETVVDLAIGRYELRNASASMANQKAQFDLSGRNLRALLDYDRLHPAYSGEIAMNPLVLRSGNNPAVDVDVKLPVRVEKDKLSLANATLTTASSRVSIDGEVDHLAAPRASGRIRARLALDEVRRAAGLALPLDTRAGPAVLAADIAASMDQGRISVESARATLGASSLQAHGTLQDSRQPAGVEFNANLALGELGRLFRVAGRPEGTADIGGRATLAANNEYLVTANVNGRNLGFHTGNTHMSGITLDSGVTADPRRIELGGLRVAALGGSFSGSAGVENMERFRLAGNLRDLDIAQVMRAFTPEPLGYGGVVSGPVEAAGSLKSTADLAARATLAIAPSGRGVPLSGRMAASYNGRTGAVAIDRSFLALPHTRVDLAGSLGQQIQVRLVSRDLNDFRPLGNIPITLNNGTARVDATVSGSIAAPRVAGQVALDNFSAGGRPFTSFRAGLNATPAVAAVADAVLVRGPLEARFAGSVGLRNWKLEKWGALHADATIRNADVRDILAPAGQTNPPVSGTLTADIHAAGTIGTPVGTADISVLRGAIAGEPFDSLVMRAAMTPAAINMPTLTLLAGPSRVDATIDYQHAPNELDRGVVRAHVTSNQVELARFQSLVKDRPGLAGVLSLNGDATARITPSPAGTQVDIATLNARLAARGLAMEGRKLGDFTASATAANNLLRYAVDSDFAGSTIHVNGQSLLTGDHRTAATALIANLPVERVLAVAGRHDIPAAGVFSANAQVSGTLQDPHATGNFNVARGSAYGEPFDSLQGSLTYSNTLVDVPQFRIVKAGATLELSGALQHPAGDFSSGQVRFRVRGSDLQLARFRTLQERRPGLDGVVQLAADGAATLRHGAAPLFSTLNANLSGHGLSVEKRPLGDLTVTAETRAQEVTFQLAGDLVRANIRGNGRMRLAADYPLDANLSFGNLTWSGLSAWTGATQHPVEATADGRLTVSGPMMRVADLRGRIEVTRLEARSAAAPSGMQPRVRFDLRNDGPIVAALDRSVVTVQSAHLRGGFADFALSGTARIAAPTALNLRADGKINLELLEAFSPDIFSSGNVALNAAVSGSMDKPVVNGRLVLQSASFNMLGVPNGITNANGTVAFNGTEAVIQNITGESGGGKVALSGYMGYGGQEAQFRVQANVTRVRVAYPESITTEASARLTLTGSTSRSLLSGAVTIHDVALRSHTDVGSVLTSAAAPPAAPTASSGFMAGVRFDVRIRTAADAQFRTTLTQNLQADADLTLRGSPDHPGMLGRVVATRGQIVFFGAEYTIDQGLISFFDPQKINPVLNIDLSTTVQGVDVSINVAGPMDRMKLSYRSDPPMQFNQIVSLLAGGKTAITDPVLAAHEPVAPQQNLTQAGASTLLGQAVANPVSGRLQRLFGVSKLSINPEITGPSNSAAATITLQQQISRDITFTYIQDVTRPNSEVLRVQWNINQQWTAVVQRDLYGEFDLDLYWKKRFH